ncbi:hypothetical protein [Clostridium sp. ZBS13]|uniref:hypothetical protein n=1 Tax=Clostridium sp. ZBS13 TaxID=2949971 RepID=UPI00207AF618|nr:hypothetical protein [Clostridium sp. ZBS13]
MLFKVLLSLSILGSNVMLNVVMQNDKINKMPKTYKGIPMSGSELEKRMDIATFDATKKYKEGTMVKFKSLDGEYILGEAGKSAPCAGGVSAFKAYDKSSYKGHNSVIDGLENMGRESKATLTSTFYALGGGISKFSTFTRDASLEFGEKVLGLNYDQCAVDSKSNRKLRDMYAEDDRRDAEDYDKLREKAPNKDVFDNVSKVTSGGLILTDTVLAGHGLINIAKSGISLAKLSGKAQNMLKFGDKIANKTKNTVNKIGELNRLKNTRGASKAETLSHPVLDYPRGGSGLKGNLYLDDSCHGMNDIIDNYARFSERFDLPNAKGHMDDLYQIEGSMVTYKTTFADIKKNSILAPEMTQTKEIVDGVFEWVVNPITKTVAHRTFIPGGKVTGKINQWGK